ncbi:MAG: Do family serine endopeptidase [Alphaproteobacteria bacterium]|nr:Do family serine endopeptidase [Alphaproteobacteria bacterium]
MESIQQNWNRSLRFGGIAMVGFALCLMLGTPRAHAQFLPQSLPDLTEQSLPAVVSILVTTENDEADNAVPRGSPLEEFFRFRESPNQGRVSQGSGFFISRIGFVVTNLHVVENATTIDIETSAGEKYPAIIFGTDSRTDIALLRVTGGERTNWPTLSWGNSDNVRVGEWVVAIGNPLGLGGSVSAGIISAVGRNIGSGPYDDFIQTDATINRGNSGGPLINLKGEVVGINSAIYSTDGGSIGIGFAIPSQLASSVVNQLISYGETRRGWLGVVIQPVTDEIADSVGLSDTRGVLVSDVVDGGPARQADIRKGDVILTMDGTVIRDVRQLQLLAAGTEIGKRLPVEVWRNRRKLTLSLTIGRLEDANTGQNEPQGNQAANVGGETIDALEMNVAQITANIRTRLNIPIGVDGVLIIQVTRRSSAASNGITAGQIILSVNQTAVETPDDVNRLVDNAVNNGRSAVILEVADRTGRSKRFIGIRLKR